MTRKSMLLLNGMKMKNLNMIVTTACCAAMTLSSCSQQTQTTESGLTTVGNPYLPLWEHIPDGEPYVFEDPDQPGKQRVYIYGSHDNLKTEYCGRDQVVWSASVDSLNNWRYDGVILVVDKNAKGEPFDSAGTADVLYAPDVTLVTDSTGKKTYYLFPNDQSGGRNGLIAKSDRPDGPFEICNWSKENPNLVDGVLQFDPAVFVDDDGRVYGYWGFERSYAAEFDPTTMATVKPGTKIVEDMIPGHKQPGKFKFFEASSIRKIKDKYVFIYSRFTEEGEFGLPTSNYTLAYAYMVIPMAAFVRSTVSGMSSTTVRPVRTSMPVRPWWLPSASRLKKAKVVRWRFLKENTTAMVLLSRVSIPSSVIPPLSPVGLLVRSQLFMHGQITPSSVRMLKPRMVPIPTSTSPTT